METIQALTCAYFLGRMGWQFKKKTPPTRVMQKDGRLGEILKFSSPKDRATWDPFQMAFLWLILGGGFKYFLFSPLFGEDFHFDYSNIFQMG